MKKIKQLFLFTTLLSFTVLPSVKAASTCDYDTQLELQKEALNIQANYEADWYDTGEYEESEVSEEDGSGIVEYYEPQVRVGLYNLSKNLYVTVKNVNESKENTYFYEDTDNGNLSWTRDDDLSEIVNYEIKIYSNHSDCKGEELRTVSLVTPAHNEYYFEPFCEGVDAYYCEEFITTELNLTREQIESMGYQKQIEQNNTVNQEPTTNEDEKNNYIYIIIGSIIVIAIIGVASIVIIRKQRSKII